MDKKVIEAILCLIVSLVSLFLAINTSIDHPRAIIVTVYYGVCVLMLIIGAYKLRTTVKFLSVIDYNTVMLLFIGLILIMAFRIIHT